ncbi:hypothetical protein WS91_24960 [Burkholderia sp. MSMB1498]|nr:hypothetical protein WS91_24960 [Burkholderia sp. MSMB1498]
MGFLALLSFSILQISVYSQDLKSPTFPGRFIAAIRDIEVPYLCALRLVHSLKLGVVEHHVHL